MRSSAVEEGVGLEVVGLAVVGLAVVGLGVGAGVDGVAEANP